MYSTILKHLLYPIGERVLGTTMLKYLKKVEETQWWSPKEIQELQNMKLQSLIKHAYEKVPYYRRIFAEIGLTDKDIQTVEDLPKLPILTKDDIRKNFDNLKARDFNKWRPFFNATSGSTGEPLRYYITLDTISINWACTFRGWGWGGYKLGDKRATLGGSSLIPDKHPSYKDRMRWLVERTLPLSAVKITDDTARIYINKLKEFKPEFLYGYPSAIFLLASYLTKEDVDHIRPEAIFTTAEMLLPHYRQGIEKGFGCKVFDCYGCYDGGPQAYECPTHKGYHISAEKTIMEFVDQRGNPVESGSPGEIISTDLHNYAMPFIRYAVGDVGTPAEEPCPCGRGLPLMKCIEGRTTDFIALANGIVLSGPALTLVFKDCHIKQYQVIQEAKDKLVIKVIKAEDYTNWDTEHFMGIIKKHAGEGINIELEFVREIPTTKAGKHKFFISNT